MKKTISLALALMLLMSILAVPAMAEEGKTRKIGELSMLNIDEAKMKNIMTARRLASHIGGEPKDSERPAPPEGEPRDEKGAPAEDNFEVVYYDSLDAMLMALNAGEIHQMEIYNTTARYLIANNDTLDGVGVTKPDPSAGETGNTEDVRTKIDNVMFNDFAFMMTEGREALRDEFNTAIAAIKEDGTMEKLTAEYIEGVIDGKEIAPIELAKIDGAETIKVAITGCLPPMDYIAADGTPAGFNTALLAEISKRIGKNIELVQVDSMGRAPALASGTVDAVFWTRVNETAARISSLSEAERMERKEKNEAELTESEREFVNKIFELIMPEDYSKADLPGGTIVTDSYFSDGLVMVMLKSEAEAMRPPEPAEAQK